MEIETLPPVLFPLFRSSLVGGGRVSVYLDFVTGASPQYVLSVTRASGGNCHLGDLPNRLATANWGQSIDGRSSESTFYWLVVDHHSRVQVRIENRLGDESLERK
jgi:hypothetical protein